MFGLYLVEVGLFIVTFSNFQIYLLSSNLTTMLVRVENPDRYNKMTSQYLRLQYESWNLNTWDGYWGSNPHQWCLEVRSRQPEPFCHLGPKLIIFVDIHKCCLYLHVLFRHMGCQHYQWVLLKDIAVLRLNLRESDKNRQKIKPEYKLWGIRSVYSYKNVKFYKHTFIKFK